VLQANSEPQSTFPLEAGTAHHWLAVSGLQPATVENAQPRRAPEQPRQSAIETKSNLLLQQGRCSANTSGQASTTTSFAGLPLKHSLSSELQLYFGMMRRSLQRLHETKQGALPPQAVTASLATDPGDTARAACCLLSTLCILSLGFHVAGLQPILPYLVPLLRNEVQNSMDNLTHLEYMLRCAHVAMFYLLLRLQVRLTSHAVHVQCSAIDALLSNSHLEIVPYLHHFLPGLVRVILC
jgi:hypothetical protein